jgi:ActR/RegA family two-component response regulator
MSIKSIEWLGTYEAEKLVVKSEWMRDEVARIYKVPTAKIRVVTPKSAKLDKGHHRNLQEFRSSAIDMSEELNVMMLTGYPTLATAREALQLGAGEYCVKPIEKQDLEEKVARLLSR